VTFKNGALFQGNSDSAPSGKIRSRAEKVRKPHLVYAVRDEIEQTHPRDPLAFRSALK
jgi:hypothetical protein